MSLSNLGIIAEQVWPGVRFVGGLDDWAGLVVGEPPGHHTFLGLDTAEAYRLARCGDSGSLAAWLSRQVETLLEHHAQPVNQMRPWADLLPDVDAATYLGAA